MKIMYFGLMLFLVFQMVGLAAQAQQNVMKIPGKYIMPMDKSSQMMAGSKLKEGDLWMVYSDRPANQLYTDKACKSASDKRMKFMQPMYVIEETENAVRVVDVVDANTRGVLSPGAASRALWVPKDMLLLWSTCLKTRDVSLPEFQGGIFNKKAMVLNVLSENQGVKRIPQYHSHPRCSATDSINSALVYQINYVFKETETAYLLAEVPQILNLEADISKVKGWVHKSQTTVWNHRLAYEINWDAVAVAERKSKGQRAKIFTNSNATGTTIFQESPSYYSRRAIGEVDRFPVLDDRNGISKVGVIGELRSEKGQTLSSDDFAKIKHIIDSMATSLRNVNVIFVIDATSSMIPYSKAIQDAVKNSMRNMIKSPNNFKFGALIYRDASEGTQNVHNFTSDLSSNSQRIVTLLSRYMTPTYNKCNPDEPEAVFYAVKKAVERFDPPEGESNFVILIGDAGNHNRTTYKDCTGKEQKDFTATSEDEVVNLLAKKNINLISYQVNHQVAQDVKPVYDAFRTQTKSVMEKVARKRIPANEQIPGKLLIQATRDRSEVNPATGLPMFLKIAPDGGTIHPTVLAKDLENGMSYIDDKVNHQLNGISQYLNGKIRGQNVRQLSYFIDRLKKEGITQAQLDIVFQKNGQMYNTGYVRRQEAGMKNPIYQDVLLMSHDDLYAIKRSLERLIPTDELSLSANDSRSYIVYGWQEILVDILGYFPEMSEAIDTLSLYSLSAILTGWGGKEKYKKIRLIDVSRPDRFPDVMLYEYLIDWCITKGHIQSIYEGKNLLTADFFEDHKWSVFYNYLFNLTKGKVEEDPKLAEKFSGQFKKYDSQYNNFKSYFRIPVGTGSGLKHYWVDSRIFPHNSTEFGDEDIVSILYKGY